AQRLRFARRGGGIDGDPLARDRHAEVGQDLLRVVLRERAACGVGGGVRHGGRTGYRPRGVLAAPRARRAASAPSASTAAAAAPAGSGTAATRKPRKSASVSGSVSPLA